MSAHGAYIFWSFMSLSQRNLSSIQKAGQAVHGAAEAISATVRTQAENMVANVANNPFGAESEQAFTQFRTLARLSQDLIAVELQLQGLYATATELARPESDVVIVLPSRRSTVALTEAVPDVVAKPAKVPKVAKVKVKAAKAVEKKIKEQSKKADKPTALTANDTKLLEFLQTSLKADDWTTMTGAVMSQGSGLPLGSVGVSLKKILALGTVKKGERGGYQLSA
jgi:hypothetical protein